MIKFKLFLYKFLGKFITYFKRKFITMSFEFIKDKVDEVLHRIGYNSFERNRQVRERYFEVEYDITLKTQTYSLRIKLCHKDGILEQFQYQLMSAPFTIAWQTSETINENKLINDDLLNIRGDLNTLFSRLY